VSSSPEALSEHRSETEERSSPEALSEHRSETEERSSSQAQPRPVDILAIGAHPDDVEIGCAGVLALASDAGLRVVVADLTRGELGTLGSPEVRDQERRAAAEVLGIWSRPCLNLPDTRVGRDEGHVDAVVAMVRELRPRVVLAPHTDDRHPDHAAAGRLAREACFFAGLVKVGTGAPHRPHHLFHYMLHNPFAPSFVVDVTATWSRKVEAVEAYVSQFGPSPAPRPDALDPRFVDLVEARARLHGAMIGVERGEAYFSAGPVPLVTLPGLVTAAGGQAAPGYNMFL